MVTNSLPFPKIVILKYIFQNWFRKATNPDGQKQILQRRGSQELFAVLLESVNVGADASYCLRSHRRPSSITIDDIWEKLTPIKNYMNV
jgi:hypothetical protein